MRELFDLSDRLKELRIQKGNLEDEIKGITQIIDKIEMEMSDRMLEHDLQRFNRNGTTFYYKVSPKFSPLATEKEAVFRWLKENGYDGIVKETVHHQTFNATMKELVEEEGDIPEGLADKVALYEKVSIGMRHEK